MRKEYFKRTNNAGYKGKDFSNKKRHSAGRRVPSAPWMGLQRLFIGEVLSFVSVNRANVHIRNSKYVDIDNRENVHIGNCENVLIGIRDIVVIDNGDIVPIGNSSTVRKGNRNTVLFGIPCNPIYV